MANGLEIVLSDPAVKSVFVNVFGGITACDAVANGILQALQLLADKVSRSPSRSSSAWTATTRRPAARSSTRPRTRSSSGSTPWTVRPRVPPSSLLWGTDNGYLADQGLQGHRSGITGSEGTKHTKRMLAAGTNVVGGTNRRRPGRRSTSTAPSSRSSAPSRRPWRRPVRTSPSSSCRRRSPRPPWSRRSTPRSAWPS